MRNLNFLVDILRCMAPHEGIFESELAHLSLVRIDRPTVPELVIYEPALCFVAQGVKETRLDSKTFHYGAGHYLLGSVQLPVIGAVTQATKENPYLCLRLDLASADIVAAMSMVEPLSDKVEAGRGLVQKDMDAQLIDTLCRLAELSASPAQAKGLGALTTQEVLWRILQDPHTVSMFAQLMPNGRLHGLCKVITWLEKNYASPTTIDFLASMAGMSPSSFHSHFKTLSGTSPLRFRTRLRLVNARQLMLCEGYDAASAGFKVGYSEPAQFNREYTRMFGQPPKRDIARLKTSRLEQLLFP